MLELPVDDILSFWFGVPDRDIWFQVDERFDREVRRRFATLIAPANAGSFDAFAGSSKGALALTLALDQFPRNIHRGTPAAYACDAKAREVAGAAIAAGIDQTVATDRRLFLYLPFEHSETLVDQHLACRLIGTLADARLSDYAERHRRIIARFGRFPHRNAILGRVSTEEERAFLEEPDSSF